MDARRYDKNADQLAQILWHYTKLQKQLPHYAQVETQYMLELLHKCMVVNDQIGKMREKGLL